MKEFKLVTKDIHIDIEPIKKVIIDKWLSGELYRFHYKQGDGGERLYASILASLACYADDISDEITESANLAEDECLFVPGYSKSDKNSIIFEVVSLLAWYTSPEKLTTDDIPVILEFLDTPFGKELEAWDKWEKYWANLDYPERRKKLLENCEKTRKIFASNKIDVLRGFPKSGDLMSYLKKDLKKDGRTLVQDTYVNTERLKGFIINEWQLKRLYKSHFDEGKRGEDLYKSILIELSDFVDKMEGEILENARKEFGPEACLDWVYPKSDVCSIGFEVLNLLYGSCLKIESLTTDDIPAILEFLDTPPDKSLEAWEKWEKYWANLDYAKRRKKLLENAEQ